MEGQLPLASGAVPSGHVCVCCVGFVVLDGQVPSEAGAEPSGHVCGDAGVLSFVAGVAEPPLLSVAGGVVGADPPPLLLPPPLSLLPLLPPLPPLSPPPLPPPPLLSLLLLSCFFANTKFTLLPVTKPTADSDDTSVNTRNTKIIFLAA